MEELKKQDGKFALLVGKEEWQEIPSKRTESGKTYALNGDAKQKKKGFVAQVGVRHYKDDYNSKDEEWKDIDLTWEKNRITKAPYELTLDGQKITVRCKKTGEVSTIELLEVKPSGLKWEIVPQNTRVNFRHILPTGEMSFEAKFRVEGKIPLKTRAFDDDGELELETTFKNGILTEKLSQAKDKNTGEVRATKGSIRIDPTLDLQVGAGADDGYVVKGVFLSNNEDYIKIGNSFSYDFSLWSRWNDVEIPQGSSITNSKIQYFHADNSLSGCRTQIYFNDSNNASNPTSASDYDEKQLTTGISWEIPTGSWEWQDTPDISDIVAEVIDRSGWEPGNSLMVLHKEDGSDSDVTFNFVSYELNPDDAPKLLITYEEADPDPDTGEGESHLTATSQLTASGRKAAKSESHITAISKLTATGRKVAQAQADLTATSELTATGQKYETILAPKNFQAQQINDIIRLSWEVN